MRSFVILWLLAFLSVGVVAFALGSALSETDALSAGIPGLATGASSEDLDSEPFPEAAAVDVVAGRLAATSLGEQYRGELRQAARITYHSPRHWTVRWGAASWTAHGPGRYAEPDNDIAREREAQAATGP